MGKKNCLTKNYLSSEKKVAYTSEILNQIWNFYVFRSVF